jgi:ATP-dependent helicase HrpA
MRDPTPFPFRVEFPAELPISSRAEEITEAIQRNPVIILAGETGSGKSTQIPKMCLAAGRGTFGRIACTQPRRVAALSVSRRVAEELGVAWGREVGCKVRFNDETTRATRIKFLTDGMLLSEAQGDPLLREYDTIIVDEAHERSLNIDFLLGHLRQLTGRRPDLKIIITSATIDTAEFSAAFGHAPVIKVEGRTFPVEVIYAPLDSFGPEADAATADQAEKAETLHYIDGAVEAVDRILRDSSSGDVLVFMPSERDVRDSCDLIEGRVGRGFELVPLFGRLTNAEQQRVFSPSQKRKIVVATNIAETSLTIPGIRYVVDTGLARVSRYVPQARTRRLPIEEISQSSADQRKGRCGRVSDGVCIRLFSQADYLARPRFTQPEIQRANLADVILRLKAFAFGEAEDFPFLNPPLPKAVRAGYALLEELGALEPDGSLSEIGRDLARLPVDPTVGRMILQARREKALNEVLVIAAGLSVQDPRERPLDKQDQADSMHRKFAHPESDFLVLLNIWESYHGEFEQMTQAKLRRFCREHFLSYTRMREWRDVHSQLVQVLGERREFKMTSVHDGSKGRTEKDDDKMLFASPSYRAIHRSILTGLLGNLATWDEVNPGYKATHDRRVSVFPGSMLFRRPGAHKQGPKTAPTPGGKGPVRWLMAAEIMETTRLYARTCARIDPEWAAELGAHVTRVAHSEPFWDEKAGRVKVKQRTRLYGIEIDSRAVSYGKINPAEATDIFIREGLVNDTITWPFDFLIRNRALRERILERLARARHGGSLNLDEMTYRFYSSRLSLAEVGPEGVSAVADLVILVRERKGKDPHFLEMEETDLFDPEEVTIDEASFPASLPLQNTALPLMYAFSPGKDDDGVTLDVDLAEAVKLTPAALDWAVPGHLKDKVEHYLRSLPKELRNSFVPLAENAARLAVVLASRHRLTAGRETVAEALAAELRERNRLGLTAAIWEGKPLPEPLRVRVRVLGEGGVPLVSSREWPEIAAAVEGAIGKKKAEADSALRKKAELGLESELRYELAWLEKDLRKIRDLGALTATLAPTESLQADAHGMLRAWAVAHERLGGPRTPEALKSAADETKVELRKMIPRFMDTLREILDLRSQLMVAKDPYSGLQGEIEDLVGPRFMRSTPLERFWHLPRYLKAMKLRSERWRKNPVKDAERAKTFAPYSKIPDSIRWLVEEFRVSLFAQELGTSEPVSAVKLDQAISAAGSKTKPAPSSKTEKAAPAVIRLDAADAKSKPLKSLTALDKLFTR